MKHSYKILLLIVILLLGITIDRSFRFVKEIDAYQNDKKFFKAENFLFKQDLKKEKFPVVSGKVMIKSKNGSKEKIFHSIQKAVDVAEKGDHIYIGSGTYKEWVKLRNKQDLVIEGAGWNKTIILGGGPIKGQEIYFSIDRCSNIILRDLTIRGSRKRAIWRKNYGLHIVRSHHITADKIAIENVSYFSIALWSGANDCVIKNCLVSVDSKLLLDLGMGRNGVYSSGNKRTNYRNQFLNNHFQNVHYGISLIRSEDNIVQNNRFHKTNTAINLYLSSNCDVSENAITNEDLLQSEIPELLFKNILSSLQHGESVGIRVKDSEHVKDITPSHNKIYKNAISGYRTSVDLVGAHHTEVIDNICSDFQIAFSEIDSDMNKMKGTVLKDNIYQFSPDGSRYEIFGRVDRVGSNNNIPVEYWQLGQTWWWSDKKDLQSLAKTDSNGNYSFVIISDKAWYLEALRKSRLVGLTSEEKVNVDFGI